MQNKKLLPILFLPLLHFIACSSSIEQTREEETKEDKGVYIFDQVPEDTSTITPKENFNNLQKYYLVQIGAFTTKDRAENFAEESRNALAKEIQVTYNIDVNLFVVQLKDNFKTKDEAEQVRNGIWSNDKYKDAWIVTVTK
jgi:cell division protein FtsN